MIQLIFVLVLLIPILAIVLDSPVGRALAGRLERRSLGSGTDEVTAERLSYLEGEFERLASEVRRLEEEIRPGASAVAIERDLARRLQGADTTPDVYALLDSRSLSGTRGKHAGCDQLLEPGGAVGDCRTRNALPRRTVVAGARARREPLLISGLRRWASSLSSPRVPHRGEDLKTWRP